jgi:hypothetical protein
MNKKQYVLIIILMAVSALVGALVSSGIVSAQSTRAQQLPAALSGAPKWDYQLLSGAPNDINNELKSANPTDWEVVGFAATAVEGEKPKVNLLVRRPR